MIPKPNNNKSRQANLPLKSFPGLIVRLYKKGEAKQQGKNGVRLSSKKE